MERLLFISGPMAGYAFELDRPEITLGREPGNRLQLVGDRCVSRKHALIYRSGAFTYLEDMGSKNGTVLNGIKLSTPIPLSPGDTVQVAFHVMRYEKIADPPAVASSKTAHSNGTSLEVGMFDRSWIWAIVPLMVVGPIGGLLFRLTKSQMVPYAFVLTGMATALAGLIRLYRSGDKPPGFAERAFAQTLVGSLIAVLCAIWVRSAG